MTENLSEVFDMALQHAVNEKQKLALAEGHQQAIDSCNAFTGGAGLFSEGQNVLSVQPD